MPSFAGRRWSSICRRSARWRARRSTPSRQARAERGARRDKSSPLRSAARARTHAARRVGRWSPSPGMARPVRVAVEKPQVASGTVSGLMPARLKRGRDAAPVPFLAVAEQDDVGASVMRRRSATGSPCRCGRASKLSPDFERRDGHLGRAEQHAVDGVEIALHRGEDVGERLAVVLRLDARQLVGELLRGLRRSRYVRAARGRHR